MSAAQPLISVHSVSYRYPRAERLVLHRVNLTVMPGESIAIVGPSGSGKSTLLALLAGYVQQLEGSVDTRIDRRRVAFLAQEPHVIENRTVLENLKLGAHARTGLLRREAAACPETVAAQFGLAGMLCLPARKLSGGERARLAIARTILLRPQLILADEITGNLDAENSVQVIRLLTASMPAQGSLIVATHDPLVSENCDRKVTLS